MSTEVGTMSAQRVAQAIRAAGSKGGPIVAEQLSKQLGMRLTLALGGVSESRRVRGWIAGERCNRVDALRAALQATAALGVTFGEEGARAWFTSVNPGLNMESPLVYLRKANDQAEYDHLVRVAAQDAI
jgi:hypothetical protein